MLKLVVLGHFLPFYRLKMPKIKILKNEKICWRYYFTHVYQKSQSYDVWFLRYGVQQTEFFVITDRFFGPRKSKFWKNEKNTWRHDHFPNFYHKWQSYDIWFFRYGVEQTKYFVILDLFCLFTPLTTWKIKILTNWKKSLEISSFYLCVPKIMIT